MEYADIGGITKFSGPCSPTFPQPPLSLASQSLDQR